MKVVLAARNIEKSQKLLQGETKATLFKCDGSDIDQVEKYVQTN